MHKPPKSGPRVLPLGAVVTLLTFVLAVALPAVVFANAITVENARAGNPPGEWDIPGAGDLDIQGFATDISVAPGGTVHFKISSASDFGVQIYRLGYYQGNGARLVEDFAAATFTGIVQAVPAPDSVTGLVDCGGWSESASWTVPVDAVSGIYIAKLTRQSGGSSHIVFIVRDDASHSDLLFKTSDATWQAYNAFGGNSLYVGSAGGPPALNHASKVSYNRPFITRDGGGGGGAAEDWLFNAEYPAVRWLEANGYDVTYTTDVDADRIGNLIANHKVFLSVGHDEYWSGAERAYVQAARDKTPDPVHLAFLSGNEVYWKTRWENSTDVSNTPYRTLVCYKEGTLGENACGGKCDPLTGSWTGLWRDGCTFSPPADGCRPENALTGQISWDGSIGTLQVQDTYKAFRIWRGTAVTGLASGTWLDLTPGTLGYEWDWEQYESSYPAGRVQLSTTTLGAHTHHLSLYRSPSGALVFGAGTVQWAWGLDGNHDRGSDPPSAAMQQATANLFAEMGAQPASPQSPVVAVAATGDVTPPVSTISIPAAGASLPAGTTVTITGTASDAAGVVAGVEVSVDGGGSWHVATGAANWSYTWTPSVTGGATLESRAFDDLGNLEVPGGEAASNMVAVTVTAGTPAVCPCTIWSPAAVPGTVNEPDNSAYELGMKFRATADGFVTGVRFYKSAANTGTHVGNLWSSAGASLASATFTGETASGWQEVSFGAPVAITAGTTYVASYHTGAGHYSQDVNYFASGVDSPPLRALADGEDGPNGLYTASAASVFPASGFSASNYWVDVVYATTVGPDLTPPVVVSHVPATSAVAVSVGAGITATFNEAIDPASVGSATFELRDAANVAVAATVNWNAMARTATLAPAAALSHSSVYSATLKGGLEGIRDVAGNALAADVTWSFTTAAPPPPPPTEGPGGPILVISAAANPFSRYFVEILRAEGLNEFTAMDLSLVTPEVLAAHDVVILGEMPVDATQAAMLTDWTTAGGTLVAMRPDARLAGLLGITPAAGTLANKYLLVNTSSGAGVGIVGQTIQFHGTADLYTLNGAASLATLYSDATTAAPNPAVTSRAVGPNGGRAVAFTYDLARSVVYTRQGNPAWQNQKRDGAIPPIRSDDLFYGNASFDPQPDWVDLNKVAIPQADEQQRLLANVITLGNLHRKPLPRFWYLPKGLKAAIVMTGDNHGDGGMQPRFDIYRNESPVNGSVLDWECVRATGYEYVGSGFTNAQAVFYDSLGFEVALHIDTGCASVPAAQYEAAAVSQLAVFGAAFPGIPLPQTNRTHCIAWTDYSSVPELQARQGIRFDTNYYYWPYAWFQGRSGMFTGSGIPMRFAKEDGTIVDCYQGTTQMTDDALSSFGPFCNELLDRAQGAEGYYGVFTTNLHFDNPNSQGSNDIVASAQAHGVPVVSAKQMLDWLDGRNGSSFSDLAWSGNTLSFTIATAAGSRNLRAMLPTAAAVGQLTGITFGATPIAYTTQTIKGVEYAFFAAEPGAYVATYLVDTTAPLVTGVSATPHDDGTATVTWTTNEASDSRVEYGTESGTLDLGASGSALVTSHGVTLTGLVPSTTFYYRVTSADGAANAATEPPTSSPPLSFTTPAPVCFVDGTAAQFGAGAPGAGTLVTTIGSGAVILAPAAGSEFAALPPVTDWQAFPFAAGGAATVSGGQLAVDGARFNTEPVTATYGAGTSVEFTATFNAAAHQYIGFGGGDDVLLFYGAPWAMFGTGTAGVQVLARVFATGGAMIDYPVPLSLLGTPHKYRVDWKPASVEFYVDDALVHTEAVVLAAPMRVAISDLAVGGPALGVDWIHVSPYAASGSFVSRVYDAVTPTTWGAMSWTATLPAGTSVQMFTRQGGTPAPDGSWTAFTGVSANGAGVGGTSRYLQYRADLATTVPSTTPGLAIVHVSCASGPDLAPPVISNVTATPGVGGTSAAIGWSTDELATSRVDYGTAPDSLALNGSGSTLVGTHVVTLTGLAMNTTYYYRITSADGSNNTSVDPAPASPPHSFTTSGAACAADAVTADFLAGTPGAATCVSETADGEVILKPAEGAEFTGTTLPGGWTSGVYGGSPAVVAGGHVSVDGAYAATAAFYGPGRSVEFVATFDAVAAGQHAGFGNDLNAAPWAIFSTHGGGVLEARTNDGGETGTVISGVVPGVPHRFRIDWTGTQVAYRIDGGLVATHTVAIAANMRPIVAKGPVGGNPLQADWMRMTPYPASGSYASRVFDAAGLATWGVATWAASVPAGTSLALFVRHGNTPSPDGTWSAFAAVPSPGTDLGVAARYLQYRADLATTDPAETPALLDVAVACTSTPDHAPPVITAIAALPGADGLSAIVTWNTDELATSRVDYGTAAGSLGSNVAMTAFVPSHSVELAGLSPGTTYYYRVTSADVAGNPASSPVPPAALSFTTPAAACPSDRTAADFGLGTTDAGTVVSLQADGEVILRPAGALYEFPGTALPADWHSGNWFNGGTSAVSGGRLEVSGGHASTDASFGPGRSLEFTATFSPSAYQNIGFAGDSLFNNPWVTIGQGGVTDGVYARAHTGASVLLSASALGSPHRYRIDWNTNDFVFYVDDAQVGTMALAVATSMVAMVSDYTLDANPVRVDWLRVTPYAMAGSFTSRVFDGYGPTAWGAMTWTASTPGGTGISLSTRAGNTAVPDGGWTAFVPLGNGQLVGGNTRYVQYRADLTSAAPGYVTPVLADVAIACVSGPDVTAPVISGVVVTPATNGQGATLSWTTDEPATSRVDYGASAGSLGLTVTDPAYVRSHTLVLAGLSPGLTYFFRVRAADPSGNEATDPQPPAAPLGFTTAMQPCFVDNTVADFGSGTLAGTAVSHVADGEVILAPALGDEFDGTSLSGAWTSVSWTGGTTTVSGGQAGVDGSRLTPMSTTGFGAGRVLEFTATFGAALFQNAGFGAGDNSTSDPGMFATGSQPWAMFGDAGTGTRLYARLNPGGDVDLGTGYTGGSHRYAIDWRADSVIFLVDGASVNRRAAVIAVPMRPGFSDYFTGGAALQVDWVRVMPYAPGGTFTSRVYDSGAASAWGAMTWSADLPAGTGLAMSVRKGATPTPDAGWSAWAPVPGSGTSAGGIARYIQYSASLTASADLVRTPALLDVGIACGSCTAGAPGSIADLSASATGNAGGGRLNVRLAWSGPGPGDAVGVYRKAYGDHPLYRTGHGAAPAVPATPAAALAEGWTLTGVTATGGLDAPPARDFWYHVAFVANACGVVSGPSNMTPGTLDYLLGDVSNGSSVCAAAGEAGDGRVDMLDMSAFGAHYATSFPPTDDITCLDVGPTVDFRVRSRPRPDGRINFEDLMIYALNYEAVLASPAGATRVGPLAAKGGDQLRVVAPDVVRAGEVFDVFLHMSGSGAVHAVSARLAWNAGAVAPAGCEGGPLLAAAGGVAFSPAPGEVDVAVLGASTPGIAGEGDLAVLHFRALVDGAPGVRLAGVMARDAANQAVALGTTDTQGPAAHFATSIGPVFPNPFRGALNVSFSLARDTRVQVTVFDLAGRVVRRLEEGVRSAGVHVAVWDGRSDAGQAMGAGLYVVRLQAGEVRQARRVQLVR